MGSFLFFFNMVMKKKLTLEEVDVLMQKPAYERTEEEHEMLDEFFEEYFKDVPECDIRDCVRYPNYGNVFFRSFEYIP